ncbi:hypothetical protein F444_07308 [Phytophthora nicotianae P1976]|uniref:Uncharacterized protein n=1 Tax=Phytophthora nicotianae P1976 TaxID=1317066 RepID=A0A081AF40_PHYNI|nr:hypothetical protein F444_07308 [Phytophthora nicotianae P1976]
MSEKVRRAIIALVRFRSRKIAFARCSPSFDAPSKGEHAGVSRNQTRLHRARVEAVALQSTSSTLNASPTDNLPLSSWRSCRHLFRKQPRIDEGCAQHNYQNTSKRGSPDRFLTRKNQVRRALHAEALHDTVEQPVPATGFSSRDLRQITGRCSQRKVIAFQTFFGASVCPSRLRPFKSYWQNREKPAGEPSLNFQPNFCEDGFEWSVASSWLATTHSNGGSNSDNKLCLPHS